MAVCVGGPQQNRFRFGGWIVLLGISMIIAMGPYLIIDGSVFLLGDTLPFYLPASTIDFIFPLFSITAMHAYRYSAVVCIALAVLAARGMNRWTPIWMVGILLETTHCTAAISSAHHNHTSEPYPSKVKRHARCSCLYLPNCQRRLTRSWTSIVDTNDS